MPTKRDLLSITDLAAGETLEIIRRAKLMKKDGSDLPLLNKNIALLFEKPSLRTRTSFQVGIQKLGGYSVYLGGDEVGLGKREPVADIARVLAGYTDCIIARVSSHQHLVELARYSDVPVINALSDLEHPCQILADLLTIDEHLGKLDGIKLAFIGDGNNVARSLCLGLSAVGASFTIAAPDGYNLDSATQASAGQQARTTGAEILALRDPIEAVGGADVVYTDVWASMGHEDEVAQRQRAFQGYTVNAELMSQANSGAIFMHDMPAHYGEEVPPGMLDHPQSVAFDQAHNRMYAQMALLEFVLK